MPFPGSNASFNEPQSNDPTSAPPMPDQQPMQSPQPSQGQAQGLAQALAQRKKKGLIGPIVKPPSTLASAISKAKRARPSADKFG